MKLSSLLKYIPNEIRILFFIKIFATFNFAVLYSSLILYLTHTLGFSSSSATGVVGVFISLNFLLHFFGGYFGGKYLSNRGLLCLGICLELLGILLIPTNIFAGLGVFVAGSGIYATSINAIMLQQYKPDDDRREVASFWVYSGMNLGFFVGNTVSGYFYIMGEYGTLFLISAVITFITLALITLSWRKFKDHTTELSNFDNQEQRKRLLFSLIVLPVLIISVIFALYYHSVVSSMILIIGAVIFVTALFMVGKNSKQEDRNKFCAFIILVFSALLFWSLFFIGPMGLTLFIKDYVDKSILGIAVPPQWFNNINTIIIVIGGPALAQWFKNKRDKGSNLSYPFLFAAALLFIGTAYSILPIGIFLNKGLNLLPVSWVVSSYMLLTFGELFLSPVGLSMIGKLAPNGKQGVFLGIWSMVSGISSMISKYFSQMMVLPTKETTYLSSINSFTYVFNLVGWLAIVFGVTLMCLRPFIDKLIFGKKNVVMQNQSLA